MPKSAQKTVVVAGWIVALVVVAALAVAVSVGAGSRSHSTVALKASGWSASNPAAVTPATRARDILVAGRAFAGSRYPQWT